MGGVLSGRRGGGWLRCWRGVSGLAALSEYEVAPGGNVDINFEKVLNIVGLSGRVQQLGRFDSQKSRGLRLRLADREVRTQGNNGEVNSKTLFSDDTRLQYIYILHVSHVSPVHC